METRQLQPTVFPPTLSTQKAPKAQQTQEATAPPGALRYLTQDSWLPDGTSTRTCASVWPPIPRPHDVGPFGGRPRSRQPASRARSGLAQRSKTRLCLDADSSGAPATEPKENGAGNSFTGLSKRGSTISF